MRRRRRKERQRRKASCEGQEEAHLHHPGEAREGQAGCGCPEAAAGVSPMTVSSTFNFVLCRKEQADQRDKELADGITHMEVEKAAEKKKKET